MGYVLCAGFLIWLGWPLSAFAIVIGVVAYALRPGASANRSETEKALRRALFETAISVLIGLVLVWVCQIAFALRQTDPARVKHGEESLIHLRDRLEWAFGVGPLLVIAVTSVVLTVYRPKWRVGPIVAKLRTYGTRLLLIVNTAACFTFFTCVDIADHEGDWVAERRQEIKDGQDQIAHARRELAAMARVKAAWEADPERLTQLAGYLKAASATNHGTEIMRDIAASLAKPEVDTPRESEAGAPNILREPDKAPDDDGRSDVAVLAETDRTNERTQRLTRALEEGRTQLQQLVAKGLETMIPEAAKGLVRPFLEALVDGLAERAVDKVYPDTVVDLQTAVLWTGLQRTPDAWRSRDWERVEAPEIAYEADDPVVRWQRLRPARLSMRRSVLESDAERGEIHFLTQEEAIVGRFNRNIDVEGQRLAREEERRSKAAIEARARDPYRDRLEDLRREGREVREVPHL